MDGIPLIDLVPPHFVPVTSQRNISSFLCQLSEREIVDQHYQNFLFIIKIILSYVMLHIVF